MTRLNAAGLILVLCTPISDAQDVDRRAFGDADRSGFDGSRGGFRRGRGGFGGRRGDREGAGWGGGDPVSRLDTNQNGVIDQEEIDRIPERFRGIMEERGFDLRSGQTVDDMRNRVRERFDDRRREQERLGSGDNGRANRSTPPPPFKPRDRRRITVDLPKAYVEADSDLDGQIGLYEWIVARRQDLEQFDEIDGNGDGLLTPRELVVWDKLKADAGKVSLTVSKRERLVIIGAAAGSSSGAISDRGDRSQSVRSKGTEQMRGQADWTFGRMDRDRDGTISLDEWGSSRRIRPWFESAGVKIQPMSQNEFSKTWVKLATAKSEQANGSQLVGTQVLPNVR